MTLNLVVSFNLFNIDRDFQYINLYFLIKFIPISSLLSFMYGNINDYF